MLSSRCPLLRVIFAMSFRTPLQVRRACYRAAAAAARLMRPVKTMSRVFKRKAVIPRSTVARVASEPEVSVASGVANGTSFNNLGQSGIEISLGAA